MLREALVILLSLPWSCLAGTHFEYGGLNLQTDLGQLKQRYPDSMVGREHVRLSATDSHDGIYYVQKRTIDGKEEIRIVFEKPSCTFWLLFHFQRTITHQYLL